MKYTSLPNFYTHTVTYAQSSFLTIHQLGRDISTPGFSYPHYNNNYVISVVRNGKGILETNGKKYSLSKNDVFFTAPNELSIQTADQQDPWEICFIAFDGTLVKELINKTVFKNGTVTATLKTEILANEIIDSAIFLNGNTPSEFSLLEYFFRFLTYLDIQKAYPLVNEQDSQNKYVIEIKNYIQANYLSPIKISDMADRLSINRSHLYRIFKKEMGITVEDYIINIRMTHAKTLLRTTSLSVSAIATAVGYKDPHYFSYLFKKTQNMTPTQYRGGRTGEGEE